MQLAGKTVLLTGATGGLGQAIASALAARGARMILSSRKQKELELLAGSLGGEGHRTIVSDLAEDGATLALLAEAGDIDVLVANAALPASGKLDSFTPNQIDRALRVNLESPIQMTRELIPAFTTRRSGHFVYISSCQERRRLPVHRFMPQRNSGCVASPCVCATTCDPQVSACPWSAPGPSATRACTRSREHRRRR